MAPILILETLVSEFGPAILAVVPNSLDPFAKVDPDRLQDVCLWLRDQHGFRILNDITGVDYLEPDAKKAPKAGFTPHLEVVYHLSAFAQPGLRITLKVELPRLLEDGSLPSVPSVSAIWRAADWHEREVYDLLGVRFQDHPDLRRILLADDWVGHPLRKDYEFPLEYHDIRCR
jgi:NADH-quinone oxidoreductase subunit C